jgi:predicted ribosomally synthesized peptide with nif11-like leader
MSKESLAEFYSAVAEDAALQDEIRAAAEGTGDEATVSAAQLVEIASARGFEFTEEEALGVVELDDDELEAVAGGLFLRKHQQLYDKWNKTSAALGKVELLGNKALPLASFFDVFHRKWLT